MEKIPEWALRYVEDQLSKDTHVIDALMIKEGAFSATILMNTNKGAVLLKKTSIGEPRVWQVSVPGRRIAFTCHECAEKIELINPEAPRDVYCTYCGAKYNLLADDTIMRAGKIKVEIMPSEMQVKRWESVSEGPFMYNGYTLYSREVKLKNGGFRTIYFFSKREPKSGKPSPMPEGYEVGVNNTTGLPFLRKAGKKIEKGAPPAPEIPFKHGDYALYARKVKLKNGGEVEIYFFSKHKPASGHMAPKPEDRIVGVNKKTGLPFLRKMDKPEEEEKTYRPQCAALTDLGEQCRNSARAGSKYCASHKGYQPPTAGAIMKLVDTKPKVGASDTKPTVLGGRPNEKTAVPGNPNQQCAAVTSDGMQCKNLARDGSKYCALHKEYYPKSTKSLAGMRDTKPKVGKAPDTAPAVRKQGA